MYISLGYNCDPRIYMKRQLDISKDKGYMSCPFDLCISNFNGVYQLLENDFHHFFDNLQLIYGENASGDRTLCGNGNMNIMNSSFIVFNHEGSTHSHLFTKGKNDDEFYTRNDFDEFKKRYKHRIDNFYKNIESSESITFITNGYTLKQNDKLLELLKNKFPNKEILLSSL